MVARALSCVARSHVVSGGAHLAATQPRAVVLNDGNAVSLRGPTPLAISVAGQFTVVEEAKGWTPRVLAYFYVLAQEDTELLSFHWHPVGPSPVRTPHLHVGVEVRVGERWLPKVHVPTGVIALQDILLLAFEELSVEPIRDDWGMILAETRS
ncbi:MAG: hypothetical protein MSC31_11410 [Solirubrobacteraceae bacterium MAG38_C4-C5]|nr:hypothetical protein [Candidatus Siliceabacter maunaloa]